MSVLLIWRMLIAATRGSRRIVNVDVVVALHLVE
jgi:hypothetical protein